MELQQLLHFKELGMGIPDKSILRAAFITNKRQVMQDMEEQNQQQMQQQQAEQQKQEKLDNAKVMAAFSKSRLDMAKIDETYAKVNELNADAEYKKAQTELDLVKSMLGLEAMDLEMIGRSYEIAMMIKGQNTPKQVTQQSNAAMAG